MYDPKKIKKEISELASKITQIEMQAENENRPMTTKEISDHCEMVGIMEGLEKFLPEPARSWQFNGKAVSMNNLEKGPFRSLGEQMQVIAFSGRPGAQIDQRLYNVRAAATGIGESQPTEAGFLVQNDFSNEILANVFSVGKIASLCRRISISTNSNSIEIPGLDETSRVAGSRWGGVQSYWLAEASEITATRPKFRKIKLVLKKQAVLIYVTDELLQDVSVLEEVIKRIASDEISFSLEDCIINGTGVGQPLGVLASPSLVSVPKETGQTAKLLYENITNMWTRLLGNSRANAVWVINQALESYLYTMSLSVGVGGSPVFMPGGGASAQPVSTLFGRPIITSEHCSAPGTVGDIILADFTNGYILAEKGGVQSAMSLHCRFTYDEQIFRFLFRCDGQPVLSSAVTPFKGTATQSHFVCLASR